jgi:hypothetical protein
VKLASPLPLARTTAGRRRGFQLERVAPPNTARVVAADGGAGRTMEGRGDTGGASIGGKGGARASAACVASRCEKDIGWMGGASGTKRAQRLT